MKDGPSLIKTNIIYFSGSNSFYKFQNYFFEFFWQFDLLTHL
ncbi:hypothetical protein SAMN06298216_3558 [Spirosomataceae bacterium TFI 002]|nr:hypothetical protein SAMN06298216_3558 [Spirosomataceae bacterium TFI 002]